MEDRDTWMIDVWIDRPDDVPSIIGHAIAHVNAEYAAWVESETRN